MLTRPFGPGKSSGPGKTVRMFLFRGPGSDASGHTNRQIARDLGLSEGTVRKHLENIYRQLGAQSRTQAVFIITNAGISPST
jgi:hypothetical protein